MAVLEQGDLSLEVAYRDFEGGWIVYDITPRWRRQPILNDAILKRHNDYWGGRGVGAIRANEHRSCGFLDILTKVLKTKKSDYWQATDPDILLSIHIGDPFPFLEEKWRLVWEKPELAFSRRAREAARKEQGVLPDDTVEFLLFVDSYNFAGEAVYQGDGLCFRLRPSWSELGAFRESLKGEYLDFAARHGIDEFNLENFGSDWVPPQY
jgi:hypothetical protein